MEVIILANPKEAAELTSRLIAARLRAKPDLLLGLATGRTMERVYDRLVAKHQGEGLDFSRCRTFKLWRKIGLWDLLRFCGTAGGHFRYLATPQSAYFPGFA
jgi:glucosamine-6-phosphate deaminase